MKEQHILLSFLGDFDIVITDALLKLADSDKGTDEEIIIKKKVYKVMVECLENLCRHAEIIEDSIAPSLFYLSKTDQFYYIISGNYIKNRNIDALKKKLDMLNGMNKSEMKQKYREVLSLRQLSEKGGAGVGIIDMAIKSENKLDYKFIPIDDSHSFYTFKVSINIRNSQ